MVTKSSMLYGTNNSGLIVRVKAKPLLTAFGDKVGIFVSFSYIGFVELCNTLQVCSITNSLSKRIGNSLVSYFDQSTTISSIFYQYQTSIEYLLLFPVKLIGRFHIDTS